MTDRRLVGAGSPWWPGWSAPPPGHRVALYDQRGHGASTMGPDAPTVAQLGDDLAAVLGAQLVEVPGAGHMLPYEEPDLLAEIIISATQREGAAS